MNDEEMERTDLPAAAARARFTHRLVAMEDPEIVDRLRMMAHEAGHSLGAEVREALRWWIRTWERNE